MIIDWSVRDIKAQIDQIYCSESNPRMDGFVTWGCKQDLYQLLWYVEDTLDKCSTYADEEEFLRKREKQKTFKILGGTK